MKAFFNRSSFSSSSFSKQVLELDIAVLSCTAVGVPTPVIKWYLDGDVIDENFDYRYQVAEGEGNNCSVCKTNLNSIAVVRVTFNEVLLKN